MLKSCCFCVSLFHGSLLLAALRALHWALLLGGSIYVAVNVFSPDSSYMPMMTRVYIETNSYILFLIMIVSVFGLIVEAILIHGLIKKKYDNFRYWYVYTTLCFLLSIVLAINFILGLLEIPYQPEEGAGNSWIQDAFCALFYTEYFFIPDYMIGPRLTPVLTACIIIVHLFLPCFHCYAILVVRAHVKRDRYRRYLEQVAASNQQQAHLMGEAGVNGGAPKRNLCAKCALRQEEVNGIYRCESAPLKPFETTC